MEYKTNRDVNELEKSAAYLAASGDSGLTGPGYSNAPTYSALGFDVDPRTGTLSVNISPPVPFGNLGSSITPAINYLPQALDGGRSFLGLPLGWTYAFSYIYASQVYINGMSSYYIDNQYESGMRYYNLKDAVFSDANGIFPYDPNIEYTSTLQFLSGETQFFDANGRLLGIADRWGNHVIFYYIGDGDVFGSKLSHIVGFAGQKISFSYDTAGIYIAYPHGGANAIEFSYLIDDQNYLIAYLNPIGQRFTIENLGGLVRNDLISRIDYPNGLSVSYDYGTLSYYADAARSEFFRLDAICRTTQTYMDAAEQSQSRIVTYSFDPNGDAHNYTGYPTYAMGKYADTLLESNDADYRYVSQIDDGVLITERQYNRLHLELVTRTYTKDVPARLVTQVTNTFKSETGAGYFPPFSELKLIPNYQTPVISVSNVYNDLGEVLSTHIESDFDDYGALTETRAYSSVVGNVAKRLLNKMQTVYDSACYGQIVQQDTYDYTGSLVVRRTANGLTPDGKNIQTSIDGFVFIENDDNVFRPQKKTTCRYNASGKIIYQKLEWVDGAVHALESMEITTSYVLDGFQFKISNASAHGLVKTTVLDTVTGWVTGEWNALNHGSSYTYDNVGRKVTSTDPLGAVTKWIFDDAMNKATCERANGYETYVYTNGFGEQVGTADNNMKDRTLRTLTSQGFNNKGQLIWSEGIVGIHSRIVNTFDSRNRLASVTDALGNVTRFEYDAVAQTKIEFFNDVKVNLVHQDDNSLRGFSYSSRTAAEVIAESSLSNCYSKITQSIIGEQTPNKDWIASSFVYDLDNQVSSFITGGRDNMERRQDISRDLFSNAILTMVRVNATDVYESVATSDICFYNGLSQLVSSTNALGQQCSYEYNEAGVVSKYIDYAGTVFTCTYYANNQLATLEWVDRGVPCKREYVYWPNTNKTRSIEEFRQGRSRGRIAYSYKLNGAIESVIYPDGRQVRYQYDQSTGLPARFTDAADKDTVYTYDRYGRLVRQAIDGTDYSISIIYYSKDESAADSGKVKSIEVNNGIVSSFVYDGFGSIAETRISSVSTGGVNGSLLRSQYTYDPVTRALVTVQSSSSKFPQNPSLNYVANYSYNSLSQLARERRQVLGGAAQDTIYQYDAAGNVICEDRAGQSIIYTYDLDNKLLRIGGPTGQRDLTYDTNGNLVDNGLGEKFIFDAQNRLVDYSNNGQSIVAHYDYYPDGLRASKEVNDGPAIQFYYDYSSNPNIVNEIQGDKTSYYLLHGRTRYIRLLNNAGAIVPEYFIESFKDVIAVANETGEVTESYAYEPYGKENASSDTSADISINPFRFTAEYTDMESSLVYLRARYYGPEIKRFMSRDTAQLINRYNYANGNPIMGRDPSGHMSIGWVIGAAIAGIVAGVVTGGVGALVVGTGMGASVAVGVVAGIAGTAVSNGVTEWGHHASGESALSAKDWGVSLLAGAAAGAVGAGVGGAVGRGAMGAGMKAGLSVGRVTAVGVSTASAAGGFTGSVAAAGITAGFDHENFFSSTIWEGIAINTAVGIGAGVMASGAHFGSGRLNVMPVEMTAGEFAVLAGGTPDATILELNPTEAGQWTAQQANWPLLTGGNDTVIVHGHPRFSFPQDNLLRYRYASAETTAAVIRENIPGGAGVVRLISCYAGRRIGMNNMAQTIANALQRPVEAYSVAIRITEVIGGTVTPVTYVPST